MSGHVISSDVLLMCGGVSISQHQSDIVIVNVQKRTWQGVNLKVISITNGLILCYNNTVVSPYCLSPIVALSLFTFNG